MKLFDIWVDQSTMSPGKRKLIVQGVQAPSFRDACALTFGDHFWFDSISMTFRGEPLVGICREEPEVPRRDEKGRLVFSHQLH